MRAIMRGWAMVLAAAVSQPASAADWMEAATDNFLIYADAGEPWLRAYAEQLERFGQSLRHLRKVGDGADAGTRSNRVIVYVLSTDTAIQRLHGDRNQNVAGFYIPRVGRSLAFTPRSIATDDEAWRGNVVLFHEYAHHFLLRNYAAAYPRWYSEGFAEFNATAAINKDGSVQIGRAANHRAYSLGNEPMPLKTLLDPPAEMTPARMSAFYGRAWLLTHYLTFSKARAGQLNQYLQLFNQGVPSLEAATRAFGDLRTLERETDTYLAGALVGYTVPADKVRPAPISLRRLGAGEAAMMPVHIQSTRGVNKATALKLLPEARKVAGRYPADPAVQAMLAEAEFDAGNLAEADAAADRALAADAANVQAMIHKGYVAMRHATAAGASASTHWKTARAWFIKANRQDPDYALPLFLFYQSFVAAKERPTDNAVHALNRAFQLSPQNHGVRFIVARQLARDKRVDAARTVLRSLVHDPHGPGANSPAGRLLARLDAGGAVDGGAADADEAVAD